MLLIDSAGTQRRASARNQLFNTRPRVVWIAGEGRGRMGDAGVVRMPSHSIERDASGASIPRVIDKTKNCAKIQMFVI